MSEANKTQIGGEHYKTDGRGEEHWDRVARMDLDYFQACITKYVERCWDKNGIEDLRKARHFIDKYIELSHAQRRKGKRELASLRDADASPHATLVLADSGQPGRSYIDQDGPGHRPG